jgi:hypothetical protein
VDADRCDRRTNLLTLPINARQVLAQRTTTNVNTVKALTRELASELKIPMQARGQANTRVTTPALVSNLKTKDNRTLKRQLCALQTITSLKIASIEVPNATQATAKLIIKAQQCTRVCCQLLTVTQGQRSTRSIRTTTSCGTKPSSSALVTTSRRASTP